MRALLMFALTLGVAGCDFDVNVVGPRPFYCPPLDSALVRAKRDSFPSPLYCPLLPPDSSGDST